MHDRIAYLADVVRRNIRRHPDRDTRGSVDEQLRQARGEDDRLRALIVEIGDEVDRIFVDLREHLHRDACETRFGVSISGRWIAVDRAKITVTVDEWIAQRKLLRHAYERVVHRGVAVRVKALEDFTDHTGAFTMLLVGGEIDLAHRVEDAALHGLEAVAYVGERARSDDRHRVREITLAHFVFDVDQGDSIVCRFQYLVHYAMRSTKRPAMRGARREPGEALEI